MHYQATFKVKVDAVPGGMIEYWAALVHECKLFSNGINTVERVLASLGIMYLDALQCNLFDF